MALVVKFFSFNGFFIFFSVWFEPTDVSRATKPFLNKSATPPAFISPNYMEFLEIYKLLNPEYVDRHAESHEGDEFLCNCINQAYFVAEVVDNVIITLGKRGVLVSCIIKQSINSCNAFLELACSTIELY